jgi:predicted MFS family arabinose efflux permease
MHRLASRYTEVGVLTASLFVSALTLFAIPLTGQTALLAAIAFTLGLGLGCAQPITIILTYNHAPAGRSGEALGMRLTVNKLTQIAVPVVFGGMSASLGLLAVFWSTGLFLLSGGLMLLPGARRGLSARRALVEAGKSPRGRD